MLPAAELRVRGLPAGADLAPLVIGQSEMDQLLAERDNVNRELRRIIDEPPEGPWGIRVTEGPCRVERVELKDVNLPEQMKRFGSGNAGHQRSVRGVLLGGTLPR